MAEDRVPVLICGSTCSEVRPLRFAIITIDGKADPWREISLSREGAEVGS